MTKIDNTHYQKVTKILIFAAVLPERFPSIRNEKNVFSRRKLLTLQLYFFLVINMILNNTTLLFNRYK